MQEIFGFEPTEEHAQPITGKIVVRQSVELAHQTVPYLNGQGDLVIPFGCARQYRWWLYQDSRSLIEKILLDLDASPDIISRYLR